MSQPPAPDTGFSDAALVERIVARDPDALELLYDRYARPCFSLARRITADATFAEDVVQEVFLTLWRDPSRFDAGRGGFASWLLAMTHHKAVDAVRREETLRRRRAEAAGVGEQLAEMTSETPAPYDQVWSGIRGERVRAALGGLPDAQRRALVLAYFGGYTQREVAALTDTPLGTVKTRMLAGMRRLKTVLGSVDIDGFDINDGKAER